MSPASCLRKTSVVILMTLTVGGLLGVFALALLLTRMPSSAVVTQVLTPDTGILITRVPTVSHQSGLIPSPQRETPTAINPTAMPTIEGVQTALDPFEGRPISVRPAVPLIPGPLFNPLLNQHAGPVAVPLEVQIPALKINAPVLGVGLSETNAMASPVGMAMDDPIWQTVFWYRGGGIPGDVGTATMAGHFDDDLGRPAVFAFLSDLQIGDVIIVKDKRSGLKIPFIVTEMATYTDQEAAAPDVLARVFGTPAVNGAESLSVSDQLSHLTLITCGGAWTEGTFDRRLVIYATRASYPL